MQLLLVTSILTVAIAGMAIGVIFNRKPLSGSCGAINQNGSCSICGDDQNKCEQNNKTSNF